jgi:transcriptional regulator with XRE-family HTH domain
MSNFDKELVAMRIKYCRLINNLSQNTLAKKLKMSRTNIVNYEAGRVVPPANILFELGEIFSVSTDFLLGREQIYSQILEAKLKAYEKTFEAIRKAITI